MKIAIAGTKGIPNRYGGFEQFAEMVSPELVRLGHDVTVYNPSFHGFDYDVYEGVRVVRRWCPEKYLGAAAHIIYDFLCTRHAIKSKADIILHLGYHSAAPAIWLYRGRESKIVTNMDGLEWKRSKWGGLVRRYIRWAERLACKYSDSLVADNVGIRTYLEQAYSCESVFIPYGAEIPSRHDASIIEALGLTSGGYDLVVARLEPENNIEFVLRAYLESSSDKKLVVVGSYESRYAAWLMRQFDASQVDFVGGIYDKTALDALRASCDLYIHGHSVGGANPSLLEAMAAGAFIVAHDNEFNRSVLKDCSRYFVSTRELAGILDNRESLEGLRARFRERNITVIKDEYNWDNITSGYDELFRQLLPGGSV